MATISTSDGTTIWYESSGATSSSPESQPAVLLVHGITENNQSLAPVAERLRANHQVTVMDLRGHGSSSTAERYDLEAMAGDVIAVMGAAGLVRPHIVGHSLGGAVVSAVGAAAPVSSVVNIDQPLVLGAFKEALAPAEPLLRDPATFGPTIDAMFGDMYGPKLSAEEQQRLQALRRADQTVVLGVWELIFSMSAEDINATVEGALAGYQNQPVPYLSLLGTDLGPDYSAWLTAHIPGAQNELWPDHGHYPHLVDPDRMVARLESFWADA